MLDVYDFIRSKSADKGGVILSIRQIAEETGLSAKQIRQQISTLSDRGYIKVSDRLDPKNGGRLPSSYEVIGLPGGSPAQAELVRAVYVRYASERSGKNMSGSYFVGYRSQFERIAAICEELDMDIHAYVLACFFALSAGWCRKTFRVPYPPPNILASKAKARHRYDTFIRQFQHEYEGDTGPKAWVMQSVYFIRKLKMEKDVPRMAAFVKSGDVLPEVFMCMPSVAKADWSKADIDEDKVDVTVLKAAHSIVYQEFAKNRKEVTA